MSEQEFGSHTPVPDPTEPVAQPTEAAWSTPPPPPGQAQYVPSPASGYATPGYPPPGYVSPVDGLSDNTAGALAYVTIIPAIIFLVMAPYSQKPFVRFHAVQELGLFVVMIVLQVFLVIPILGWIVYIVGAIAALICWVMAIVKASQGSAFKIPFIGNIAEGISGYKA